MQMLCLFGEGGGGTGGGQSAARLPSEVRMSENAGASPQDGEEREEMLGGGRRGGAARREAHVDADQFIIEFYI